MDSAWLDEEKGQSLKAVKVVLLKSRRLSTRITFLSKWKRFSIWSIFKGIHLMLARVQDILDYLLHLKSLGLAVN